jgi:radical SAM protein (TIGR01212 family)
MSARYNSFSDYLKARFGSSLHKVSLNAGFTCPTRDGAKGLGGCIYCEPKTLVRESHAVTITEQLERGMERLRKTRKAQRSIAYFQVNTNTYDKVERLRTLYEEAMGHPRVAALAISTRPDCVGEDVLGLLEELKKNKPLWLELGLQSAKDSTLRLIRRGHTAEDFRDAVLRASKRGIEVSAHVIMGLPGETKQDMLSTVRFISGLPVRGIKFRQLDIVRGAALEEMHREEAAVLSLEEYSEIVVESLELMRPDMVVERLSGATPRELLIAPLWGRNKSGVKGKIMELLEKRNTCQGRLFKAAAKE